MLPQACLDELMRREQQSGVYRTRVAAAILCDELLDGDVRSFNSQRA